jgi:hypothetical protein
MKLARPVLLLTAATVAGALALPASASTRTRTVYFDNQGSFPTGSCKPSYVLTKTPTFGNPCEGQTIAAGGRGASATDVYDSLRSAVGFKLDTSRALTGTVYVTNYGLVSGSLGPVTVPNQIGGPVGATVTIAINGVTVGSASGTGVAAPGSAFAIPVSIKLPKSLSGKVVKDLAASVKMTTGVVLAGVTYGKSVQSKLVLPSK